MKNFMKFALKKKIIVDEKELEGMFKDLNGDETIADKPYLKRSEFERIFSRALFKASL